MRRVGEGILGLYGESSALAAALVTVLIRWFGMSPKNMGGGFEAENL